MKNTILSILICIFVVVFCASLFFINSNREIIIKKPSLDIIIKEQKTKVAFNEKIKNSKFKIENSGELEVFKSLYKDFIIDEVDYENYTLFIETKIENSFNNELTLEKVNIDKRVEFNIKTLSPEEESQSSQAYWYILAIIPKEKLKEANTNEWHSPTNYIEYITK